MEAVCRGKTWPGRGASGVAAAAGSFFFALLLSPSWQVSQGLAVVYQSFHHQCNTKGPSLPFLPRDSSPRLVAEAERADQPGNGHLSE